MLKTLMRVVWRTMKNLCVMGSLLDMQHLQLKRSSNDKVEPFMVSYIRIASHIIRRDFCYLLHHFTLPVINVWCSKYMVQRALINLHICIISLCSATPIEIVIYWNKWKIFVANLISFTSGETIPHFNARFTASGALPCSDRKRLKGSATKSSEVIYQLYRTTCQSTILEDIGCLEFFIIVHLAIYHYYYSIHTSKYWRSTY